MVLGVAGILYLLAVPWIDDLTSAVHERTTQPTRSATAVDYSKPPWERIPQATVEEVTTFATTFLGQLGYHVLGQVNCDRWDVDFYQHKQFTCYAAVDPAWPPLSLKCGPRPGDTLQPMGCVFL